jgi:hypothetical protein
MEQFLSAPTSSESSQLLFAKHQGYDLREQWITRGLLALAEAKTPWERARVFAFPEAVERFGIGPRMVNALRFWLRATGLIVEREGDQGQRFLPDLTPLGACLARADPSLQRSGSRWLLHARLAQSSILAPTWYWFFQCFVNTTPFTKEACFQALLSWAIKSAPTQRIAPGALRKDLACLLRLYTTPASPPASPERQLLSSPFRQLGLLREIPAGASVSSPNAPTRRGEAHYLLCPPQAGDIPPLVVLALILEQSQPLPLVPLTHLLYRHTQVGRTCCLKQQALLETLQRLQTVAPDWSLRNSRLGEQAWLLLPPVTAEQVLCHYYQQP